MASSVKKKDIKKAKKVVKKAKKTGMLPLLIVLVIVLVLGYFAYTKYIAPKLDEERGSQNSGENKNNGTPTGGEVGKTLFASANEELTTDFYISFLEVGNKYTGDAIYIKAGDNDILIDAGSRNASSTTIANYVDQYCTDGTLEYVIATHAHQDHIAGFVGTKANPGIFDKYECKIIIDFPKTNATTAVYNNYVAKRDAEVEGGATHYTALECYNNENGASRVINLASDVTMEILYNYYYENETSNENNYSVCVLLTHGDRKFLLTGDLEAEGEEYLVDYNDLPKVNVYKAGHHGSYTAGSLKLLDKIQPEMICVCCCAGSDEYTKVDENMFPAQDFISRACKYTPYIYVTSIVSTSEAGFESLNGTIKLTSNKTGIVLWCSNNTDILKDTEWFKEHRKWE